MLRPGTAFRTSKSKVELGQAIRSGVAASVFVHLTVLALILVSTEVHPHRSTTESIAVDIVAPAEVPKAEAEKKTEPEKNATAGAGFLRAQSASPGRIATSAGGEGQVFREGQ